MGIDDQRRKLREEAVEFEAALARKQALFEGIADRVASALDQSLENSSAATYYYIERHQRASAREASAGVVLRKRGSDKSSPFWALWIKWRAGTSDHVKCGFQDRAFYEGVLAEQPDFLVEDAIQQAEGYIARDMEASASSGGGCALSLAALAGCITTLIHIA